MSAKTKKRVQVRPGVHTMSLRIPLDLHAEVKDVFEPGAVTPWIVRLMRAGLEEEKKKRA